MKKNKKNGFRFMSRRLKKELPLMGVLLCLGCLQPAMAEKLDNAHTSELASQQQKVTLKGVVRDVQGMGIPGVSVIVKGTTMGTVTDVSGKFLLEVTGENVVLEYSFIGFKTVVQKADSHNDMVVVMVEDVTGLEEVVVVGYGSQKKNDLTGAIYSVKADQLEDLPNINVMQGLQGAVPGLNISNTQSAPGATPKISIRGENSLSASNSPLIILDGIPFEGNMNDISPSDIQSVSVLKDASSSAIYGSRGANGVILISTKKGKKGKARINYSGYFGFQSVENKIDLLDGPGYVKFLQDYNRFTGNSNLDPENLLMADEIPQYKAGAETDWQDMVFRVAPQQEHQISMSGGNETTQYYSSLGFMDQRGLVENSGMQRYTVRTNVDHKLNAWLKTGVNMQLTYKDLGGNRPSVTNAIMISPYGKVRDDNGSYTHYPQSPQKYYSNPFADDGATVDNETKRILTNVYTEVDLPFIKGLSYRLNFGVDYYNQEYGDYYPSYTLSGRQTSGLAHVNNFSTQRWTWENIVKYTNDFGSHHIDATGLYSREGERSKEAKMTGKGFVNDDNLYHYLQSADQKEINSKLTETDLVSYMGRVNYSFANKYFVTVTGRVDGYSGFGKNNKYGFFPSLALGWNVTQEEFMKNSDTFSFVDFLKIRGSYGQNGNMGVNPYKTLDSFANRYYVYGDNANTANGVLINTIGNPDLCWESTVSFNVGMDFALLDNRISGNVEYYRSHSNDLLMQRQLPVMNGYTSIWYNVGKTENWGLEFNVNTVNVKKDDFEWTSNFNFSLNRDKIVELRGDGENDLANKWFIGESLRVYYDYKMNGIWQTDDDIANSHMPDAKPGTPIIKDVNKDGKITGDDREIIGSSLPDWIGGMTNNFSYKNWNLSVYVNTVQGITKENSLLNPGVWLPAKNTNYVDIPYWTPDRPSNKYVAPGYDENALGHKFYQDASFVRIKDVSLSYNFPESIIKPLGIGNLKVYVSGKNLYTFTDWIGYDPEASNSFGAYPNARTVVFGVNLGL